MVMIMMITTMIAAMIMAYKPMKSLSGINTNLQEALAAVERFYVMVDQKEEVIEQEGAASFQARRCSVTFNDVSFRYDEERAALDHVTIEVPEGKTVALVGPSGGGK